MLRKCEYTISNGKYFNSHWYVCLLPFGMSKDFVLKPVISDIIRQGQ